MKKDILIILACLCVGSIIIGCEMAYIPLERVPKILLYDIATDAVIDTILPGKEGKFEGIKLGMTQAEVREVIEESKSLTLTESGKVLESGAVRDQAKTVMWDSETWVYFFYQEERLYEIRFGMVPVSEELIETKVREQFRNFLNYFSKQFGDPSYWKENFPYSWKITVSSFKEASPIELICGWGEGNVLMGVWLYHENAQYSTFVTITERREN